MMKHLIIRNCVVFSISLLLGVSAVCQKPTIAKEPSWVSINHYDYSNQLDGEAEDGYIDLVFDFQISVGEQANYFRKTVKILSESGIQNCSQVSVNFDPSYEKLTFHKIRIIRGTTIIDQLNLAKIKTIQQESDLDRFLYDESRTAMLILEDVRKGDLIEYSYTIKGVNPVFKGKFFRTLDLNFSVPVNHIYYKLIVPKDRSLTIKNKGTTAQPTIQSLPGSTNYEWKLENVPAFHVQDNLPGWYDPYSMVMVSEYKSWKEVSDWAVNLFPTAKDLSVPLQTKIDEIRKNNASPEAQILAALRFVQDDIRYMGIEIGENSHRPAHPNKIMSQRFGDCKDKSYLLCTMLKSLGFDAVPVLINSQSKKAITEWLPSAGAFDHATVRLLFKGNYYWFDPTIAFQRGNLNAISYPDYQYGLPLSAGTDSLMAIPHKKNGGVIVKEVFDIPDMSGNSKLTVTTRYTGAFADDTRGSFSNSSLYEIKKTYREFYARYYEDISSDSISYKDETDSNGTFIVKEYYSIKNLWGVKLGMKEAFFEPYVINGLLRKPKESTRKMPFALSFPSKCSEEVIINLPTEWSIDRVNEQINADAFRLSAIVSYKPRKVTLKYDYEALKDHIAPEQSRQFIDALEKKEENFGYSLSWSGKDDKNVVSGNSTDSREKAKLILLILITVVLVVVGWYKNKNK